MLALLIFTVGLLHAHAVSMMNSTGTVNEEGVCQCSVILPDNTFPADRLEVLEVSSRELSTSVHQEIIKIQNYQATLTEYIFKLKNLTRRVEIIELGGISYTELDFELLKIEIREMESLVVKLKQSFNGSSTLVESLFVEIHNIAAMVNQLESYDKNNVLAVRREIASLRKKLEDCKKNQDIPTLPPVSYGTCNHGGLKNISKPFVVQLNWLGFTYKFGGWGKDTLVGAGQDLHWMSPLSTDARIMNIIRSYPTYEDLLLYKRPSDMVLSKTLPRNNIDYTSCGQGGGMILFNNSMYYNCYNTRDICKYNLNTGTVERKTLTDATFNNRFSYSSSLWQDIDLASDEDGLWVIYSTEENSGNIVIGKLNPITLSMEKTWVTTQYKPAVTNAFMICGVLYATRTLSTRQEEIFYMYDTKTNKDLKTSIVFDKMMENVQSVNYNPNDHKLYMYNDGYLVTYDLSFKPKENLS
ncbi:olfactomedin-4-like [Pyxicephalus adspersus]|uniref:Olfactomedin-like domain-containing protein n=1 Tax=Pyxicephalus adspersus TaxID=30357 RepID=A0AAV3A0Q4_PYXAD|nr:TPA: hypothetical protein GDO54_017389 [Pyxicephalus adspersus]